MHHVSESNGRRDPIKMIGSDGRFEFQIQHVDAALRGTKMDSNLELSSDCSSTLSFKMRASKDACCLAPLYDLILDKLAWQPSAVESLYGFGLLCDRSLC